MAEELIIIQDPSHYPIQVVKWKVTIGDSVFKDQALGIYEYLAPAEEQGGSGDNRTVSKRCEIRSKFEGKILKLAAPHLVLHSEK